MTNSPEFDSITVITGLRSADEQDRQHLEVTSVAAVVSASDLEEQWKALVARLAHLVDAGAHEPLPSGFGLDGVTFELGVSATGQVGLVQAGISGGVAITFSKQAQSDNARLSALSVKGRAGERVRSR